MKPSSGPSIIKENNRVGYGEKASDKADERQLDERDRPSKLNDDSAWALGLNDLKAKLIKANSSPFTSSCCIYKVPPKLRKVNEAAYTPSVVSIGPYHHGDKRLESMQELKAWYVNRFLIKNKKKSLEAYFEDLKGQEATIRGCYSETKKMNSDKFVGMVFTDACFIIEFFLVCAGLEPDDPLVGKLWRRPIIDIKVDLILLENQLPFFVLTDLFRLAFPNGFDGVLSFVNLTRLVFKDFFLLHIYPNKESHHNLLISFNDHNSLDQVQHLCDVLRTLYLPSNPPERSDPSERKSQVVPSNPPERSDPSERTPLVVMNHSHSVRQLHEAGMKFQVDQESSVTKLQCSGKVLKIPGIVINDFTETMLRNVVAFEQCHLLRNVVAFEQGHNPFSGYVTDYVRLLDNLIDSGKDVEILVGNKIMDNLLGDSYKVASMVNKLCINVLLTNTNSEYISLYEGMDKFCEKTCNCHRYMAIFVREYWSTPWKIASVIAATLLLFLTLIQTISSVISL